MVFRTGLRSGLSLESPESLFSDIKAKKISSPWAGQADVWRNYVDHAQKHRDVAFQIPTGGGKTLVGVVLAEWWRRKNNEQVIFLCPTRQLVNQVAELSRTHYGIPAIAFTRSKTQYTPNEIASYLNAESIAITTYSSLFNVNPFFDSPDRIILDDAHAAEQYISELWRIRITKTNHKQLFETLSIVLKDHITSGDFQQLVKQSRDVGDHGWVQKLPSPSFQSIHNDLRAHIDTLVGDLNIRYSWSMIKEHLDACHLYYSNGEILIRPLLSPTSTHSPFSGAKQRLYMSATLGQGGELERITGVKRIHRIETNEAVDKQLIGRRYFIFPERNLTIEDAHSATTAFIREAKKALVISPSKSRGLQLSNKITADVGFPIYSAHDLEESKAEFVAQENAVALVTNRYDGVNFPGDESRLLILDSLPQAMNLQERFLINRIGCNAVFSERITTRLIQAFGRCTRSNHDYSAVVILGGDLNKQLMQPQKRALLPAELQSEIQFGLENAKDATIENHLENFKLFLEQGEDWNNANEYIVAERENLNRSPISGSHELEASAPFEIQYQEALWNGDHTKAVELAKTVAQKLCDPSLRGFRTLWHYLAGSASMMMHTRSPNSGYDGTARESYENAIKANASVIWLHELARIGIVEDNGAAKLCGTDALGQLTRIVEKFDELGTINDRAFNQHIALVTMNINDSNSKKFEEGQRLLGLLLGLESENAETAGAPDPWWATSGLGCLVFEDYTEAKVDSLLSISKARQVSGHPKWIKANTNISEGTPILPVLISSSPFVDREALPQLDEVAFWHVDDFRKWALQSIAVLSEIRASNLASNDLVWQSQAITKMVKNNMTLASLMSFLKESMAQQAMTQA